MKNHFKSMNKKTLWIILIVSISGFLLLYFNLPVIHQYLKKREQEKINKNLDYLTRILIYSFKQEKLHQQMYFVYLPNLDIKYLYDSYPGTIFIHTENVPKNKNGKVDLNELKKRIREIKKYYHNSRYPEPFFAIDQEGGTIRWLPEGTTPFPWAIALGEANAISKDIPLTYLTAYHNCRELKQYGINWVLGPVADILYDLNNPAIHARSFGNNKTHVIKNIREYLKGLNDAGCMNSLKHFPGHGDTHTDSHYALPIINKNFNILEKEDLSPFIASMQENLNQGIMTSHILFSEIDKHPVTISDKWLKNIIREKYHFDGIIVTDDIGMDAMKPPRWRRSYSDLITASIKNGADMVLMFKNSPLYYKNAITHTKEKISNSKFLIERTHDSIYKIIKIKLQKSLMNNKLREIRKTTKNLQTIEEINFYFQRLEEKMQSLKNKPILKISPEKIKEFTCQKAIKRIWGNAIETEKYTSGILCISDSAEIPKGRCSEVLTIKNGISFNRIAHCKTNKNCRLVLINLYGKNTRYIFRNILSLIKRPPLILYTTDTFLPFSYWKSVLRKDDAVITSFNDDEDSRKYLTDCFARICSPPNSVLNLGSKN